MLRTYRERRGTLEGVGTLIGDDAELLEGVGTLIGDDAELLEGVGTSAGDGAESRRHDERG